MQSRGEKAYKSPERREGHGGHRWSMGKAAEKRGRAAVNGRTPRLVHSSPYGEGVHVGRPVRQTLLPGGTKHIKEEVTLGLTVKEKELRGKHARIPQKKGSAPCHIIHKAMMTRAKMTQAGAPNQEPCL